uniref:Uncharacterized protein n=1 Tax=Romanomermis culicivorax TaxID=13658 RepID=A0A915I547_ROMCU
MFDFLLRRIAIFANFSEKRQECLFFTQNAIMSKNKNFYDKPTGAKQPPVNVIAIKANGALRQQALTSENRFEGFLYTYIKIESGATRLFR